MKWINKFFKNVFKKTIPEKQQGKQKTIGDLSLFDDVYIIENGKIVEGWIIEKNGDELVIVYDKENDPFAEIIFHLKRPLNRTEFEENNIILKIK